MSLQVFQNVTLSPTEIRAGDSDEFVVVLTIGPGYTAGPSRIVLDLPATLGMSRPSLLHNEDSGFIRCYVNNPEVTYLRRNWDMEIADFASRDKSSWRGMAQRMAVIDLSAGLIEGDTVEIHWGETSRGYGTGTRATTVVPMPDYRAQVHVRYFEGHDRGIPDFGRSWEGYDRPDPDCEVALSFAVHPRKLHHLRLLRKVDRAMLLPQDVFWNITPVDDPDEVVEATGSAEQNTHGAWQYRDKGVQIRSRGAPLLDAPRMDGAFEGMNVYWGDIHSHSAFSVDCIEREKLQRTPGDLMAYARQAAGLDFYAVTDHHQPWDVERHKLGPVYWEETMQAVRAHHREGEFVVFPGIEYRCPRGDTAVVFNWLPDYAEIDQPEWVDIRKLWAGLAGKDYMAIPHFHNGGRLAEGEWWDHIADGIEPVLEIFSCHGSYEREDVLEHSRAMIKRFRPDRSGAYFLQHGYHYGLCANSDGHKGHVGSNGLTAVYAPELTRDAILRAYRERHVYGTTNARILLLFTGNGALMGSILPAVSERSLLVDVAGENALKKIDLFRNGEPFKRFVPEGKTFSCELTVREDEPAYYYLRATQVDNHIAWSSPIWFGE